MHSLRVLLSILAIPLSSFALPSPSSSPSLEILHPRTSILIATPEGSLAGSCQTLKKKTAGKAWNLYYAGHGLLRGDSMLLAYVGLRPDLGIDAMDVCAVANDIIRSCSAMATTYGLKQSTIVWSQPASDSQSEDDTPWGCLLYAADNSDPSIFNQSGSGIQADHVWAWSQD